MSLRLHRLWLILGLFIAGETFALGLGDIRLSSALNEPLRAEIQLVSATPEDLAELTVQLASAETFERYGLYRPLYLTRLDFTVVPSGRADGNVIRVRSDEPITEPFVTFLVEASWPRGRLLREYTVLLDPPTFAPPPESRASEAVTAPSRAAPADTARIERPAPRQTAEQPETASFDTAAGSEVRVARGDTLWGIAERVRPDDRLSMNQTMVAIYEANPQAFDGNINRLNAGTTLRIPSADDIFRISRGQATSEVQRQNAALGTEGTRRTEPRLTLVPPDSALGAGDDRAATPGAGSAAAGDPAAAERIRQLEETIEEQQSLIEVRDDELARLRDELARIREQAALPADAETPDVAAETAEPAAEDTTDQVFADDATGAGEETAAEETPAEEEAAPPPVARPDRTPATAEEPGLLDRAVDLLTGFWGILGLVLIVVLGILVWLAKRAVGRGEEESTGVWDALDAGGDVDSESLASTERLRALARDDDSSMVVVEQESAEQRARGRSAAESAATEHATSAESGTPTLEDTFSSETAINLDQSDPIAEADFHMAYGLYDQAADLINGALAVEPERQDLMVKLAEIYFVWGNRDAFVEAASRLHDQLGGESSPDWDKIVIMGRQIAGDHRLFSGASAGAAAQSVDLSFDSEDEAGALDMDFAGGPDGQVSDVVDLSGDGANDQSGIDFLFDEELDTGASTTREMPNRDSLESTVESPTIESPAAESTVESPTLESAMGSTAESTAESTIEQQYGVDATSELPSIKDSGDDLMSAGDATAEINLDDLGLDLEDLAASGLGDFDDDDEEPGGYSDLDETTEAGAFAANDEAAATGRNPELDDDLETADTGIMEAFDPVDMLDETGEMPSFDEATGEMPSFEEATGKNPAVSDLDEHSDTDVNLDVDATLLDATGQTQVLRDDYGVDATIGDEDKTMLASLDDDYKATAALDRDDVDGDFDFAKTEALPKDAFDGASSNGEKRGEMSTEIDFDLDLDDLTAALRLSEGDTVDQPRDDATVERPHVKARGMVDLDVGDFLEQDDDVPTEALSPEDFSDDLHEARTMTEVGTKLDLARAYVDMGDPDGARSILEEVLEEGDDGQRQQAQKLMDSLPA